MTPECVTNRRLEGLKDLQSSPTQKDPQAGTYSKIRSSVIGHGAMLRRHSLTLLLLHKCQDSSLDATVGGK